MQQRSCHARTRKVIPLAKSLRQLTANYENMVRTQRQNADKIADGEWTDDDVFAEAFRQAAAYKGRSVGTPDPFTRPVSTRELIGTYSIKQDTPLIDLDTVERAFMPLDDPSEPQAIHPGITNDPSGYPWREYDVYIERNIGKYDCLIFDLRWRAMRKEDYDERQAREYVTERAPDMLEVAHRSADRYPTLTDSIEAKAAYLRAKFGIVA